MRQKIIMGIIFVLFAIFLGVILVGKLLENYSKADSALKRLNGKDYLLYEENFYISSSDLSKFYPKEMEEITPGNVPIKMSDIVTFNSSKLYVKFNDVRSQGYAGGGELDDVDHIKVMYNKGDVLFFTLFAFTTDGKTYLINGKGVNQFKEVSANNRYDDVVSVYQLDNNCYSNPSYVFFLKGKNEYRKVQTLKVDEEFAVPTKALSSYKYYSYPVSILEDNTFYVKDKEYQNFKYALYDVDKNVIRYIITSDNKIIDVGNNKVKAEHLKYLVYKEAKTECASKSAYSMIGILENGDTIDLGQPYTIIK